MPGKQNPLKNVSYYAVFVLIRIVDFALLIELFDYYVEKSNLHHSRCIVPKRDPVAVSISAAV